MNGNASAKILVADDEQNITDVCARYLQREGYGVIIANDGEQALAAWRSESPDLVVLDVMMPGMDGLRVCEEIRHQGDTPIMMLTARSEEMDRILGLTVGADDYMTKPFSPRELVLRIKAILRRVRPDTVTRREPESASPVLRFPGMEINPLARSVKVEGRSVELTVKEFELLYLLARHPGQVFSRNPASGPGLGHGFLRRHDDRHRTYPPPAGKNRAGPLLPPLYQNGLGNRIQI